MAVLTSLQRNTLERAVIQARKTAEAGARNALQTFAVHEAQPFAHQTPEQRKLRNTLRSKGRLLGDKKADNETQTIDCLAYELAYEYWHQMLFARFLEANGLLMHPAMSVPVTLEECAELAPEEGHADKWTAAASYAAHMLPAIFKVHDPLLQVSFAANDRIALESILDALDEHIFTADDALGWVYQFWQTEAKASINAKGDKIDGAKLPAVTQLFTEPYMVHFLIDNTLGAWWVSRNPGVTPPVKFEYLRTLDNGKPAAGAFEGWPDKTAAVTTLDPCMGSGHFVAALFSVLVPLRMHEEGLSKEEATDKVISDNLHGLELDPRCTQIAAFNLALTAWKFCGRYKPLPEMHLACSGIAPKGREEDWVKLVGKAADPATKERMENGMRMLYQHFQLAPELGSLLDPTTIKADAYTASFSELEPVLNRALQNEADDEELERGVIAAGIAKAGQLLARKYTLQITNVPYLSKGKQDAVMADYCEKKYPEAKGDLATVFLEKMLKCNQVGGISCSVIPQNWLFLASYKKYREKLLKGETWSVVARLGAKGFQTPMWDFNVMLISLAHLAPKSEHGIIGVDVSGAVTIAEKVEGLRSVSIKPLKQLAQLDNPDSIVVIGEVVQTELLEKYAQSIQGIKTGDDPYLKVKFWEVKLTNGLWKPYQGTVEQSREYGGLEDVVLWKNNGKLMSRLQGMGAWGKNGVVVSRMAALPCSLHIGFRHNSTVSAIVPKKDEWTSAIWCFCNSNEFRSAVRSIDQALAASNSSMLKVPFDLQYWETVFKEQYPNGLPKPYSDDPTQWLFHGHPIKTDNPLHVALARLLGYRWPAETDVEMELADEARELIKAVQAFNHLSDGDGIVCIPPVNGEEGGADRLRKFLQAVFGSNWNNNTVSELLQQEEAKAANLEEWLRNEFFIQHCKVFQNRPFIWQIWDGRKDGFSALVNYHQLTYANLEKLTYAYLGNWIHQCEKRLQDKISGAEGQLAAAQKLKAKLEAILEGEAPYDIFVRWKTLAEQPLGWDPDLNDGVRLNIRPFVEADILRKRPNIKWGVDRGKNPAGSPWGAERNNDLHKTLEEKKAACAVKTNSKQGVK